MKWSPPTPSLHSGPILLRTLRDADAAAISAACSDAAIPRFTFMKDGLTEDQAREWIGRAHNAWSDGQPRFAIADTEDDRLLGQIGMTVSEPYQSAEAYYWVAAGERRRGVASTALGLLADWAFAQDIERLHLLIDPDNEASHRVAARCGFTREGLLRSFERVNDQRRDLVSWSLLPNDPRPTLGA